MKTYKMKSIINILCILLFTSVFTSATEGAVRQKKKSYKSQAEKPIFECRRKSNGKRYFFQYWNYPAIDKHCEYVRAEGSDVLNRFNANETLSLTALTKESRGNPRFVARFFFFDKKDLIFGRRLHNGGERGIDV